MSNKNFKTFEEELRWTYRNWTSKEMEKDIRLCTKRIKDYEEYISDTKLELEIIKKIRDEKWLLE